MSLNCNNVQDYVTLYKDGVLSDSTTAEINEHLSLCKECKRFYKEYDGMNTSVPEPCDLPADDSGYAEIAHKIHKKKITLSFLNVVGMVSLVAGTAYLTHILFQKTQK